MPKPEPPKEKVVGRTGSGKSTLCLCMFRLLEASEGNISIDDIDISKIGLEILRKNLTIIPQEPTLIEGTLKENVDPEQIFDDEKIMAVLKEEEKKEKEKEKNEEEENEEEEEEEEEIKEDKNKEGKKKDKNENDLDDDNYEDLSNDILEFQRSLMDEAERQKEF